MDAVDIAPRDIPSDELHDAIASAQAGLKQACDAVGNGQDPVRLVLAGLSDTIGIFGKSTRRWERAVGDIIAARNPLSDAAKRELVTAVEDGAFKGVRKEANRMIRSIDRRSSVMIGLSVAGAFVIGSLIGFGSGWWVQHTPREALSSLQAAAELSGETGPDDWLKLMRLNDISRASRTCQTTEGRLACTYFLWASAPQTTTEDQPAKPGPRQQGKPR